MKDHPLIIDNGGMPFNLNLLTLVLRAIDKDGEVCIQNCEPEGTTLLQLGLAVMAEYDKYRSTHEG